MVPPGTTIFSTFRSWLSNSAGTSSLFVTLIWNFWFAGTVNSAGANLCPLRLSSTGSAAAAPPVPARIKAAIRSASRVIAPLRIILIFIDNDIGSHYQQGPPTEGFHAVQNGRPARIVVSLY